MIFVENAKSGIFREYQRIPSKKGAPQKSEESSALCKSKMFSFYFLPRAAAEMAASPALLLIEGPTSRRASLVQLLSLAVWADRVAPSPDIFFSTATAA